MEEVDQGVADSGHHLDEDIKRNADNVLAGIADGIAGDGRLVCSRALAVTFQRTGFDLFLRVVERAAGVAHEDGSRNRHDGRADQQAADEFSTDQESADNRNRNGEDGRDQHLAQSTVGRHLDHLVLVGLDGAFQSAGDRQHLVALVRHQFRGVDRVVRKDRREKFYQRAA